MRRREFTRLVGGAVAMLPLAARAQPAGHGRVSVIMAAAETAEYSASLAAFEEVLGSLGWKKYDNLLIDVRWSAGKQERTRSVVEEIVALDPDVILGQSEAVIRALLQATRTTPIVFVHVADPVASGLAASLARPGGNVTGFTNTLPTLGGKWLQLLKEVAPSITRAALLFNPETVVAGGALFLDPFEATGHTLGVVAVPAEFHDLGEIEAAITALGSEPGGGLVLTPDAFLASHSAEIVALAERFRVPTVYPYRYYAAQGGLMSYGVSNIVLFRQAATYVDRILRGARPADLAIQQPTKFELVINMKTARMLGLTVTPEFLARADEVIE